MSSINKHQRDYFIEHFGLERVYDDFLQDYIYRRLIKTKDIYTTLTLHYEPLGDYYYVAESKEFLKKFRMRKTKNGTIKVPVVKTDFIYYNKKGDKENV